jgi:hypothetical protein
MSTLHYVQVCSQFARDHLPMVEKCFNYAGYIPGATHRVSGGTRIVAGLSEIMVALALTILVYNAGSLTGSPALRREGFKILDFAVHGLWNIIRGFVECHAWIHLLCLVYDKFVPENGRLSYSRPIFKG